jgi:hypothetical protein
MKRILAACLALAATVAVATTTWTTVTPTPGYVRAVKGANPTASGTDPAPVTSTASTDGIELRSLESLEVLVETQGGGNMTAGGKLLGYVWNKATGKWHPVPELDLTVPVASSTYGWSGFTVTGDYGRAAWEPSGLGTVTNVYVYGTLRYPKNR